MKQFPRFANIKTIGALFAALAISGCGKTDATTDNDEYAQGVGDSMSGVDEAGGSSGDLQALNEREAGRAFARFAPQELRPSWSELLMPEAKAVACANSFSACASGVLTRTLSSCTLGRLQLSGTVQFTFAGTSASACKLNANSSYVARVPNYSATGLRGASLVVSKTATTGQVLTRGSDNNHYSFTNDGIERKFTLANGSVVSDFTTSVDTAINITGHDRSGRSIDGGTLKITNNVSGVSCSVSPSQVTWASSTCTCPTSGKWTGTCSDGKAFELDLSSTCGSASLTVDGTATDVTMDRCSTI